MLYVIARSLATKQSQEHEKVREIATLSVSSGLLAMTYHDRKND